MKSPIETKDGKTTIDNVAINNITQRFLAAIKAFATAIITPSEWVRLGLEASWKVFLPLVAILILVAIHYLSYYAAFGVLIITAIWLLRKK